MNAASTGYRFLAATVFAVLTIQSPAGTPARQTRRPAESPLSQPTHAKLSSDYGNLPLAFEPNLGQTDARVRFLARGGGMTVFFTDAETAMVLSRSRHANKRAGLGREEAPAGEAEQAVVRMKLENASRPRRAIGLEKLPGISNYFIGNDPSKWHTNVPQYAHIQYEGVYPGIDLVWHGNQRRLEYDFVVSPGADPKQIQVAYQGAESLKVEANGDLVLQTTLGDVRQQKPRVYQEIGGRQVEVASQYAIVARNRVSFELARYDQKRQLHIDPVVLVYSTYLGGSGDDFGQAIAVDAAGSAYVTGYTYSVDFPTQSPYQATRRGGWNAFVTKLTPAGNALVYSTYLGGSSSEYGYGIAVDAAGSAYVTGDTSSTNFPTQSPYQATLRGVWNVFVTKLTPAGNALVYSTYLGGSDNDEGYGIAVDAAGSAYVTGTTSSPSGVVGAGRAASYNAANQILTFKIDAYFSVTGTPSFWTVLDTVYNSSPGNIDFNIDQTGQIHIFTMGTDHPTGKSITRGQWNHYELDVDFLNDTVSALYNGGSVLQGASFSSTGTTLVMYGFYAQAASPLVGTDSGYFDNLSVAGGVVYQTGFEAPTFSPGTINGHYSWFVYGAPSSTVIETTTVETGVQAVGITPLGATFSFPTQSPYQATLKGSQNAFVTKLMPAGNALAYSTYLGGSGSDTGWGIAVDGAGSAYVTGYTGSTNFPTQSPYQATLQGSQNAFVTKLTPAGNALSYSTYLGGSGADNGHGIAVDGAGSAYITGATSSTNFPTQSPYQATYQGGTDDAFVTKLTPAGNALVYSTYLGGNGYDDGMRIAVDAAGSAYVIGGTESINFPTQSPYQATFQGTHDAFVTRLTPAGNALVYSTYLGGSNDNHGWDIALDAAGSVYITGYTSSTNFPTQSPYQATFQGGAYDAYVAKLSGATGNIDLSNIGVFRSGMFALDLDQGTYTYNANTTKFRYFGLPGDQPVAGDWLGTGVFSLGVFRAGAWYFDLNNNGQFDANEGPFFFGLPGDAAIVGDWTGSGSTKVGVFRCPASGVCTWYLSSATQTAATLVPSANLYNPATTLVYSYGLPGDQPVANNWSGTVKVDQIGVFRCLASGVCSWIVENVGDGVYRTSDPVYSFGLTGDIAVVGDWNDGNQRKRIGVFRSGLWILEVNGTNTYASNDLQAFFGLPGDKPVVGKWTMP